MQGRIIAREPLAFPCREQLSPPLQRRIDRLEAQASQVRQAAAGLEPSDLWLDRIAIDWNAYAGPLSHPLSHKWLSRRAGSHVRDERCPRAELDAYLKVRQTLLVALDAPQGDAFVAALRAACAALTGHSAVNCRQSSIGLESDNDGTRVEFGPWQQVNDRLHELHQRIRESDLPATMIAVAALAVLLNIHPFTDGNGRSARALFNATLEYASKSEGYLPLRSILEASAGGFEIRLREAETHGNWAPLIDYFTDVFRIAETAHRAGAVAAS